MSKVFTKQVLHGLAPAPRGGILRMLGVAVLSGAVSILLAIVLLAVAPPMRQVIFSIAPPDNNSAVYFTLLALAVIFVAPMALLLYGLRRGWFSYLLLIAITGLVMGTMIYLTVDDTVVIMPATMDELAPSRPGDGESYQVILRYSGQKPQSVLKLDDDLLQNHWVAKLTGSESDTDILRQHRDEIETEWTQVAELHAWFAELSAFPRIGDLTQGPDTSMPSFSMIRTYVRFACAKAELLALDGKGDEALGILRQSVDVSQMMLVTSRSLVRIMIGIVTEKTVLDRLPFVLDHGATTPAARKEFAVTLQTGLTGGAGARRLTLVDFVTYTVPIVLNQPIGELIGGNRPNSPAHYVLDETLKILDPLLMNPHATLNMAGAYLSALADRAAQRDMAGMSALGYEFEIEYSGTVPIKNMGGRFIISESIPAFSKVAGQYWKEQDEISNMLAKLKSMDPAA